MYWVITIITLNLADFTDNSQVLFLPTLPTDDEEYPRSGCYLIRFICQNAFFALKN